MADLFKTKEVESLKVENTSLKSKIETFEVRLSIKDKSIAELTKQLETANDTIAEQKGKLSHSISMTDFAEMKLNFFKEMDKLQYQIDHRPHNERNAGRKNRATSEQTELILKLRKDGKGYGQICKILTAETGNEWNRSTVRNIIICVKELTDLHTPKEQNIVPNPPYKSQI